MKIYMQPTAKVVELSIEDAILTLSTHDVVSNEDDYSNRKDNGWNSELWTEEEE